MDVCVARQPILDRSGRTFGYELLFRSGATEAFDGADGDQASLSVLDTSFLTLGIESITGGRRAFVNFTRHTLVNGYATILPRSLIVVEILENVPPDEEVLRACRLLKEAGHMIALDDFVLGAAGQPFVEVVDIVKVDFTLSGPRERVLLAEQLRPLGVKLLAEKVETQEDFTQGLDAGYTYFQGYFFSRPVLVSGKSLPAQKLVLLQLLREVNRPETDLNGIEALVRREVSLTYKLLAYLNSAAFGFRRPIRTVRHALAMLGEAGMRKWVSVIALSGLAGDQPFELVVSSVVRARFAESLSSAAGLADRADDAFLMGLFSLIDALVGRPLAEILDTLPLGDDIRLALLGDASPLRRVLDLVLAYERASWDAVAGLASELGLAESAVADLYVQALEWGNAAAPLQSRS
jgi:EAL and modified HD-GYP domain-containing signal transduction protein